MRRAVLCALCAGVLAQAEDAPKLALSTRMDSCSTDLAGWMRNASSLTASLAMLRAEIALRQACDSIGVKFADCQLTQQGVVSAKPKPPVPAQGQE